MSTVSVDVDRCPTCGALVDAEDLFCANCGTEVPSGHTRTGGKTATEARNFQCRGCGASMNYDASAQSLKCPFCGSLDLVEDQSQGVLAPEIVLPFAIDRAGAENRLRQWLGSSFWHPNDLRQAAQMTELRAVFVPFWIFRTRTSTHWTADSSQTPWGARGDWVPVSGYFVHDHDGLWVPASSGIPSTELEAVLPFDASKGVKPSEVDLLDVTVEQFSVSRRYARPLAQSLLERREIEAASAEVPGRSRNVHVNVLMEGDNSKPALVPIYVMAYRYREAVYRFVLNGQNGRSTGTAPRSIPKIAGVTIAILVLLLIILLLFMH